MDSLIYLDTDSLVLRPIEHIWNHFKQFNSTQLAAVTQEGEVPALNWYSRFSMHPYYGKLGINSGVMLMNLTRMRAFQMEQKIADIYVKYKLKITWGDQDLLNILFHFHPGLFQNNCSVALNNVRWQQLLTINQGNSKIFFNDILQSPFLMICP